MNLMEYTYSFFMQKYCGDNGFIIYENLLRFYFPYCFYIFFPKHLCSLQQSYSSRLYVRSFLVYVNGYTYSPFIWIVSSFSIFEITFSYIIIFVSSNSTSLFRMLSSFRDFSFHSICDSLYFLFFLHFFLRHMLCAHNSISW